MKNLELNLEGFQFNIESREVYWLGNRIHIPRGSMCFDLLLAVCQGEGKAPYRKLYEARSDHICSQKATAALTTMIALINEKLAAVNCPKRLIACRNWGYEFVDVAYRHIN